MKPSSKRGTTTMLSKPLNLLDLTKPSLSQIGQLNQFLPFDIIIFENTETGDQIDKNK